jgi:hypothetical protein
MDKVFDAVCRADADALVAHGRFLAEKFGSASTGGGLSLGPDVSTAPGPLATPDEPGRLQPPGGSVSPHQQGRLQPPAGTGSP